MPIGKADETQIAAWKEKYPMGIYEVEVKGHVGYFKHPSFKEMDFYHAQAMKTETVSEGYLALTENLWVGGCPETKSSPLYVPTIHGKLKSIIFDYDATLVKL